MNLLDLARSLAADESGQDLVEYALLTGFFGLAAVAGFDAIEAAIGTAYALWDGNAQALWEPPDPS